MSIPSTAYTRSCTNREEIANWLSHGAGALAAVVGLVFLELMVMQQGNTWNVVGCTVFGVSMVLLYLASTIYHAVPLDNPEAKSRWQAIDQSAIYLLIAGSYTPFILANLRTTIGWSLLSFVWIVAIVGIVGELTGRTKSRNLRVSVYVAMGWSAVLAAGPILESVPASCLVLIGLGGAAYTAGIVFFLWRSLQYHHAIWHAFVIAGTALHYIAVVKYAVPGAEVV